MRGEALLLLTGATGLPKRGLVVTVYYDPEETKEEELQSYEDGDDGPIFA